MQQSQPGLIEHIQPLIEDQLKLQIDRLNRPYSQFFHEMLTYHMGWTGEGAGPGAVGKRLRPLLLLLTTSACNSDWKPALPAAAAIELIHNFSLVHDDIEDGSKKRRGRPTVWTTWGIPMAINVGDALFIIANQALLDLRQNYPAELIIQVASSLFENCLALTTGQYLDLAYQKKSNLALDDYWNMVDGKTAALLSASLYIGSLLGGAGNARQEFFRLFGFHLGRAFQVQDDFLGIWGDEIHTGKPTGSDLMTGKNSLPVIYGLAQNGKFSQSWSHGIKTLVEVETATKSLEIEGALDFTKRITREESLKAIDYLNQAEPQGPAGEVLREMTTGLLNRIK